jgi:hypothetical protein
MSESIRTLFVGINHESFLASENFGSKNLLLSRMKLVSTPAEDPELIICVDVDWSALKLVRSMRRRNVTTVLIASEPRVVVPLNSHPKVLKEFDKVLQIGRPGQLPLLPWPQHPFKNPVTVQKQDLGKAILIQSRKYSFVKGQLYSLRVLLASSDKRVFVVGRGWAETWYRTLGRLIVELGKTLRAGVSIDWQTCISGFKIPINLLGPAESKNFAMQEFKVAVVIENSQEYMSEKLFDALVGGCIPVYVGPDLGTFGIPPTLYVSADATLESVKRGISAALEVDYVTWQNQVKDFLADEKTRELWSADIARLRILNLAITS